jgi:hypothetical protein
VALEAYGAPDVFSYTYFLHNLGLGTMIEQIVRKMLSCSTKAQDSNALQQSIMDIRTREKRRALSRSGHFVPGGVSDREARV